MVGKNVTNNCWACAINAIKSRSYQDEMYFDKISRLSIDGFNNNSHGSSSKDFIEIIKEADIDSINCSNSPNFYEYITNLLRADFLNQINLPKNQMEKIKIELFKQFSDLLSRFGPIMFLRYSIGSGDNIHALSLIDLDDKTVCLYNSMYDKPQNISWEEFIEDEFSYLLYSFYSIEKNVILKDLFENNFTLFFYDKKFVLENSKKYFSHIRQFFKKK
ncbi:hypothetical protein [Pigmentibacter ruber]|uniref:hypothetical protein n=1 Tax=Pigmentibacter ruber TaxID=2683196 RepID=UPI0038B24F2F